MSRIPVLARSLGLLDSLFIKARMREILFQNNKRWTALQVVPGPNMNDAHIRTYGQASRVTMRPQLHWSQEG